MKNLKMVIFGLLPYIAGVLPVGEANSIETKTIRGLNIKPGVAASVEMMNSTHFHTVWEGQNGYDHMNIYLSKASSEGNDLEAGDEIALFDGTLCVGLGVLTGVVDSQHMLNIKASCDDGSGNGFTPGHTLTYKYWDSGSAQEIEGVTALYHNDLPAWSTDGLFTSGATAVAELSVNIFKLNVKVLLEGPYDTGTGLMGTALNSGSQIPLNQPFSMAPWNYAGTESVPSIPSGVTDWVLVELRDAATPAEATTSFLTMACFLKADGSIVGIDGTSLPAMGSYTVANNLYVVVRHRNHIAVMSSEGLVASGGTYGYDFSTAITKAYNGAAGYKQIATGVFGMVAGDADADGNVYPSDYNQWASKYNSTGYKNSDFDMDTNVYPSDYNKWATNYNKGNPLLKSAGQEGYRSQVPVLGQ